MSKSITGQQFISALSTYSDPPSPQTIKKIKKTYKKKFELLGIKCAIKRGNQYKQYKDSYNTICEFFASTLKEKIVFQNKNYIVLFTLIENLLTTLKIYSNTLIIEEDKEILNKKHTEIIEQHNKMIRFLYSNYENPLSLEEFQNNARKHIKKEEEEKINNQKREKK